MNNSTRIWLITGVSGGLGRALALEAAQNGDIVYGTLRKTEQLTAFNELVPGKTFGVILDVNQHQNIPAVLQTILEQNGRIEIGRHPRIDAGASALDPAHVAHVGHRWRTLEADIRLGPGEIVGRDLGEHLAAQFEIGATRADGLGDAHMRVGADGDATRSERKRKGHQTDWR